MTDFASLDDGLLLQLVAESNQNAFSELFARHRAKLYDYLFDITKSREIAEELLIDTFMKIWLGRELAPQIHHIDAFLQKVAHNKALNFLRISSKKKHLQQLVAYEIARSTASTNNLAEDLLAEKEYQKLLSTALDLLTPQRRLVFTLSRNQGLSHEEIARELQLSKRTVKNHMSEALKTVREFLASQNGEQGLMLIILLSLYTEQIYHSSLSIAG